MQGLDPEGREGIRVFGMSGSNKRGSCMCTALVARGGEQQYELGSEAREGAARLDKQKVGGVCASTG